MTRSMNEIRKSLLPAPVYEAVYAGGVKVRMSFHAVAGKPIDPDKGRNFCNMIYAGMVFDRENQKASDVAYRWAMQEDLYRQRVNFIQQQAHKFETVAGYVEHPSIGRKAHEELTVQAKAKAVSHKALNKKLFTALEELLEHVEWRRRVAGQKAGANDCTHRARAALTEAKGAVSA